ncbi:MAG TPA: hypothetical protein VK210_00140 [Terriglobia bacterium]|nr:hypothetical protein [Terriglobia bacterium]
MNRWAGLLMFAFLFAFPFDVFAQTDAAADTARRNQEARAAAVAAQQQEQERQEEADRMKKIREQMNKMNETPKPARGPDDLAAAELNDRFIQFQLAIPKFREAVDQYREAMGSNAKLDKSLKNIGAQTNVMLRYLKVAKHTYPKPDPQEFKDYSRAELRWETLNSAERIATYVILVPTAERAPTLATKTMEFLMKMDGELQRLKWLASHTK